MSAIGGCFVRDVNAIGFRHVHAWPRYGDGPQEALARVRRSAARPPFQLRSKMAAKFNKPEDAGRLDPGSSARRRSANPEQRSLGSRGTWFVCPVKDKGLSGENVPD